MSTVKRVFLYAVSLVTLGVFAGGAGLLLSLCFDIVAKEETWVGFDREQLSLGLAMLIIGCGKDDRALCCSSSINGPEERVTASMKKGEKRTVTSVSVWLLI